MRRLSWRKGDLVRTTNGTHGLVISVNPYRNTAEVFPVGVVSWWDLKPGTTDTEARVEALWRNRVLKGVPWQENQAIGGKT